MTTFKRLVIIYNPNSTGPSHENASVLKQQLVDAGFKGDIELMATKRAGHAQELAEEASARDGSTLIISSSGDGGYNEVVNGAMAAMERGMKPVCAVLPSGNANDHRRTTKRRPLAEAIMLGHIMLMDVIQVNLNGQQKPRYAHSYIGLGLTPTIALELNKVDLNPVREALIVFRAFAQFEPLPLQIGQRQRAIDSLIVSNVDGMAKVLKLAQRSRIDDGLLEVNIFSHGHKLQLVSKLLTAMTVGLKPSSRTSNFEFTVLKAGPIQLDGEVMELDDNTSVEVTCKRQILPVIV